ncbi:MAG: hypothetical protein FJ014_06400 [Chloroflexi bacterium]|nr:hypothetical protein [Chloroflexota bacterium]
MKLITFGLLILGVALSILGWLFDRLSKLNWLLKLVASEQASALQALELLAQNARYLLLSKHPGFGVLISRWPGLSKRNSITGIGRSVAFIEFGQQVQNDFELIAYSAGKQEIDPRWRYSQAQQVMNAELDKQVFWGGTIVFYLGIVITLISGVVELLGGN